MVGAHRWFLSGAPGGESGCSGSASLTFVDLIDYCYLGSTEYPTGLQECMDVGVVLGAEDISQVAR